MLFDAGNTAVRRLSTGVMTFESRIIHEFFCRNPVRCTGYGRDGVESSTETPDLLESRAACRRFRIIVVTCRYCWLSQ